MEYRRAESRTSKFDPFIPPRTHNQTSETLTLKIMRGIEIELPNQSDALPLSVLKEYSKRNKLSVKSIVDSLPPSSSKYTPISVPFRAPQPYETLSLINQTPYSLFSLFVSLDLLKIIAKNTNFKASKEYSRTTKYQRRWHGTSASEIGAFMRVLLYMGYMRMPRGRDIGTSIPRVQFMKWWFNR